MSKKINFFLFFLFFIFYFLLLNLYAGSCRFVAYYVYWNSNYRADKIPYTKLTHIEHAFIKPNSDGTLNIPSGYIENNLTFNAHANGVKVLASIGGADATADANFRTIANDSALRNTFASNIENFCRTYGYDGVDIDWEFPQDSTDRNNLNLMIQAIRDKFNNSPSPAPTWLISMAVPSTDYYGQWFDYTTLNNYVNFYNLMSYDYHGSWSSHSGHNSPLYYGNDPYDTNDCNNSVNYMLSTRSVPADMINMGIPFYGRNFINSENLYDSCSGDCTDEYKSYYEIEPLINNGWTYNWDSASVVPYLTNDSGTGVLSYDSPASVTNKVQYALSTKQLGGIFMWELSGDYNTTTAYQPLLDAMYNEYLNTCSSIPTDTPTPTYTYTFTNTFTLTFTETNTFTITDTPTETPTGTYFTMTPTNTFTETYTFTLTYTPTFTPTQVFLIDDFEDNEFNVNNRGGAWDMGAYGSSANISRSIVSDSAVGTYAGYMNGDIGGVAWSDIHIQTDLNSSSTPEDISNMSGIKLYMKGTKGTGTSVGFRIRIVSSNITDGSYWKYDWTPNSTWTEYKIPWTDFTKPGWGQGNTVTLSSVLQNTVGFQWMIIDFTGDSSCLNTGNEWYIDNIEFYKDTPTLTPTSTNTPTSTFTPPPGSTNTFTPTPTQTTNLLACGRRILAYYPYWENISGVPYSKLTHIAHAFIWPLADGSLYIPSGIPDSTMINNAHANGVRVLISVGGAGTGSQYFSQMCADSNARNNFVNNIYNFILTNNYDGVDIDWEFPSSSSDRTNLNLLIQELRDKFNSSPQPAPSWEITMAVVGTTWSGAYIDYATLNNYVDFYNLMTYDMHGPWGSHAGHNSPLFSNDPYDSLSCKSYVDYLVISRSVPPEKINLGIPFYGYKFDVENLYDTCPGNDCSSHTTSYDFSQIKTLIGNGWTYHWDSYCKVPYLTYDSGTGVLVYDDEDSVLEKVNYALTERGLGGVMTWEISEDYYNGQHILLNKMYEGVINYCGIQQTPSPTPTEVPDDFLTFKSEPIIYPNPIKKGKPAYIKFKLNNNARYAWVKIFTLGYRLIDELYYKKDFVKNEISTLSIKSSHFDNLANGAYFYYVIVMDRYGREAYSKVKIFYIYN